VPEVGHHPLLLQSIPTGEETETLHVVDGQTRPSVWSKDVCGVSLHPPSVMSRPRIIGERFPCGKLKHNQMPLEYMRAYSKKLRSQNQAWLQGLKTGPCRDCRQTFPPTCMDFDHLSNKRFNIGNMKTRSRKQIRAEIAKCELVCSNCHRLRTETRRAH